MNTSANIAVKHSVPAPAHAPVSMFGSLQREIDRLFDDFSPALAGVRRMVDVKCKMDLADTKNGLELTIELPGLEEKDVEVTLAVGVLTISGEKKFESEDKDKTYHFIERGYGSFARSIHLPDGVKAEQIKATLDKGVLKVEMPAANKPEPEKITVRAAA